jgi:IPT/TIG domain
MGDVPDGPGDKAVPAKGIITVAVLLVVIAAALLWGIISFWPIVPATTSNATPPATSDSEIRLFIIVILLGALGGVLHTLRSLYWYVGNRTLKMSWLLMYFLLPLIGASLAVVFYVVLRGGLISPSAGSNAVSPYGFAAVAALVGLFSPQAADKLKQVFETLFTTAETGKDHTPPSTIVIDRFVPEQGAIGTTVTIIGRGFAAVKSLQFGTVAAQFQATSDTRITTTVPQNAASGRITISDDGTAVSSDKDFTITP